MKNNDTALVSVVIPVYKVEQYLRECVDSVLAQTYTELEVILVDDGSPDNSGAICDEYAAKDRRVKVIHKENGGLSDARNKGLEAARGEYVYFLDSDDYIKKEAIAELVTAAEENSADIVFFDSEAVNEATDYRTESMVHSLDYTSCSGADVLERALSHDDYFMAAWINFYNADFLKRNRLRFKKGIYFEDLCFNPVAYLQAERVFCLKKSLHYYRIRDNSILTAEPKDKIFKSLLSCIKEFRGEIKGCADKKRIKALELSILYAANLYLFEFSRLRFANIRARARELRYLRCVQRQLSEIDSSGLNIKLMFPKLFYIYRRVLFPLKERIIKATKGVQS